jgi:hypothetical protein
MMFPPTSSAAGVTASGATFRDELEGDAAPRRGTDDARALDELRLAERERLAAKRHAGMVTDRKTR